MLRLFLGCSKQQTLKVKYKLDCVPLFTASTEIIFQRISKIDIYTLLQCLTFKHLRHLIKQNA